MHPWKFIKEIGLNLWNWVLDRRYFDVSLHVTAKGFAPSGLLIRLKESRSKGWVRVETDLFNQIIPPSILQVRYSKNRITSRIRVLETTVVNPKNG